MGFCFVKLLISFSRVIKKHGNLLMQSIPFRGINIVAMKTFLIAAGICIIALLLLGTIGFFALRFFLKKAGPPQYPDPPAKDPQELPPYPEGMLRGDI
jgi:hypothetical protein